MSAEAGLLQDVVENPDDDTPRLILADWWEEHGNASQRARAELIRAQIELSRLPEDDPREEELRRREAALLHEYGRAWRAELTKLPAVTWGKFVRGFVSGVRVEGVQNFLHLADLIFHAIPVRSLAIRKVDHLGPLLDSDYILRIRELDLGENRLQAVHMPRLFETTQLFRLASLLLHQNNLYWYDLADLARTSNLPSLTELYLSGNHLSERGAHNLAQSNRFPKLTLLDMRDNYIGLSGVAALVESSHRTQLRTLWLVNTSIGVGASNDLSFLEGRLPNLRSLWLGHSILGDRVVSLATDPTRTSLRDLDLGHCRLGEIGARSLAESRYLSGLRSLRLSGNSFSNQTAHLLRERFGQRVTL
jgi:uncharacterized protein (TIGR02996 family)